MEGSINKAALLDMAVYRELFNTDLSGTDAKYGTFYPCSPDLKTIMRVKNTIIKE